MSLGRAAVGGGRARRWLLLALALLVLAPLPAAARRLHWSELAVEARLDEQGVLRVRERHTMVFTGDWNGGERSFRLQPDHELELAGLWRLDTSGEPVALERGSLARVDRYDWTDRRTLRWRSRLPSDPPFEETEIVYLLEYRLSRVLVPLGERYRLDHDFAFPDRVWPIERFTLKLTLDPVWRPAAPLATHHAVDRLAPGESYVVTVDLTWGGSGAPAGVRRLPPVAWRAAAFGAAALAVLWLVIDFRRREATVGRYDPPPAPAGVDPGWLEEHLFDLSPEEAGALLDRRVAAPEVAAILARWEVEGRIRSEVVPMPGWLQKDVLKLELTAERGSFTGYDGKLMRELFFGGRAKTDTAALRRHYRSRGFDPASTVRKEIERRLEERDGELMPRKRLPGAGRLRSGLLFLAFLALMVIESFDRLLLTLQLGFLLLAPLAVLYLLLGLSAAHFHRRRPTGGGPAWAVLLTAAGLFTALATATAFFDRLLPGVDFAPQPGMAGTVALAVLVVMVWSSLLNNARSREHPRGLGRRQRLAAARRLLADELSRPSPGLDDAWMPYLLAFGLGPRVDRWWRRFGQAASRVGDPVTGRRFAAGSSGSAPSWTGGGGSFGGAGASASWVAAASTVASGVARPSSGSGGSGGGGGGGSSGGGGGGGW